MAKNNTDTQEQLSEQPEPEQVTALNKKLASANAEIKALKAQLRAADQAAAGSAQRIDELTESITTLMEASAELTQLASESQVVIDGKYYRIIYGPLRADKVLDEVKKGHVHENRTAVVIDRYE